MKDMFDAMDAFSADAQINVALIGVKLGTCGDGMLNEQEKMLIREIFGASVNIPMEQFYESLEGEITDELYNAARMLTQLGNNVAMPFLHYVLSFAYIDGVFEDEVAEELDGIFGMNLMMDFFSSDLEEVPRPKIRLTSQEAEIVSWFKSDDQLRPLADVQKRFPGKSRAELKGVLDGLCQKGILYVVGIAEGHGMLFLTNDGRIFGFHTKDDYGLTDGELFGKGFRLFKDFNKAMDEKEAEAERIRREREEQERKKAAEEALRAERRSNNLCQHCGGAFKKVLFGMKCTVCAQKKDYK